MYAQVEKRKENNSKAVANSMTRTSNNTKRSFGFANNNSYNSRLVQCTIDYTRVVNIPSDPTNPRRISLRSVQVEKLANKLNGSPMRKKRLYRMALSDNSYDINDLQTYLDDKAHAEHDTTPSIDLTQIINGIKSQCENQMSTFYTPEAINSAQDGNLDIHDSGLKANRQSTDPKVEIARESETINDTTVRTPNPPVFLFNQITPIGDIYNSLAQVGPLPRPAPSLPDQQNGSPHLAAISDLHKLYLAGNTSNCTTLNQALAIKKRFQEAMNGNGIPRIRIAFRNVGVTRSIAQAIHGPNKSEHGEMTIIGRIIRKLTNIRNLNPSDPELSMEKNIELAGNRLDCKKCHLAVRYFNSQPANNRFNIILKSHGYTNTGDIQNWSYPSWLAPIVNEVDFNQKIATEGDNN